MIHLTQNLLADAVEVIVRTEANNFFFVLAAGYHIAERLRLVPALLPVLSLAP